MKNINIFFLLAAVLLFTSCTKEPGAQYTIKGKLLKSCDNSAPVVGQNLVLEKYDKDNGKTEIISSATTDENGAYSLSYSAVGKKSYVNLNVLPQSGLGSYLENIPIDEDMDINIYARDNYFYIIKIKTDKPYTNQDTLFYMQSAIENGYIVGPFTDNQVLDTIVKTNAQGWYYVENAKPSLYINYAWKLGSEYKDPAKDNVVSVYLTPCNKYDEVVLDLTKAIK